MRSASASLESLSSPSPSLSPPPPQTTERAASQPTTAGGVGLDSGSELSELTEEEQEIENRSNDEENEEELDEDEGEEEEVEGARRQPMRRGGGRRKRGGIVPAPMWDWAYKQKKGVERGTTAPEEEEEEEEQPSPPKAMEEEEDEEEDSRHASMHPSMNGDIGEDEDEKDEEDEPWGADHADSKRNKKIRRTRTSPISTQKSGRPLHGIQALYAVPVDSDEEDDEEEDEEEPDVEEDGDVPQLDLDPTDHANASDSDPDLDASPTGPTVVPAIMVPMDVDVDENVDITAPSPGAVAPTVPAGALSIMAGSSIASATPSPDSSLSGSPASSRSASPTHEKADDEDEDEEEDGEDTTHDHKCIGKKQLPGDDEDAEHLASVTSTIDGVRSKLSDKDAEAEDLEVASVLHDELDLEIDADLQPAHRAEALDVLATIELKFALLRERVYVEKMEGLAWEEALVAEGTHPEFVYLQTELSRREAKRKELAARQRTYDISLVTKKRKMDEDFIWGWWKFARDELQTDMVSEHKRKYRRLERDRRALGQPQPVRHIPTIPREVPPPPTLRQIVKSFPYPGNRLISKKRDHTNANAIPFVYPELSTLSSADIATDLEYLYQNRRAPFDPHSHRMGMSMSVSGPQLGPANPPMTPMQHGAYDAYAMNVDNVAPQYTSGTRMPPPPPPYQQHQHHQVLQPFQSGSGRSQHHSSHPQASSSSSLHNHTQGQFSVEPEVTLVTVGPGHGQYFSGPAPGAPIGISRPISPVHVVGGGPVMSGPGGKQGAWVGDGRMPSSHHSGGKQASEYGWTNLHEALEDGRDRERESKRDRERERERDKRERNDRDRERELEREREGYMMQQQAHRHAPSHQHSHPHNPPAPSSHLHQGPHHHHRHHHHVLHHHHPQQQGNGSGQSVSSLTALPGSAPSPRIAGSREFEASRSHSGPAHAQEVLSLSASKPTNSPSPWKRDELSSSDYREIRGRHGSRPSSTHPAPGMYEDRDRPLATPFAMASSQAMSSASASGLSNGQSAPSAHSPRLPWSDEHGSRMPPSSSFPGPLGRGSPLGLSPPRSRPPVPRSPSSLPFPGPMRSPTRFTPSGSAGLPLADPPAMHALSSNHGRSESIPTSPALKARRLSSPPPTKVGTRYSPPRLSGPGRTTPTLGPPADIHSGTHSAPAPNTSAFNRTASPLMFNSPSSHPGQPPTSSRPPPNGNTTLLPAPKTNAVQMVDGP